MNNYNYIIIIILLYYNFHLFQLWLSYFKLFTNKITGELSFTEQEELNLLCKYMYYFLNVTILGGKLFFISV